MRQERVKKEFEENVIQIDRVSRTVKGGRRMSFRALVVIGNRKGKVGIGTAKATEVIQAVQKAVAQAKKNLIEVPIVKGTIPHETVAQFGSAHIFMKPAASGTSIIAGSSVRSILELAGIKNILTKIIGSSNKLNNAKATIIALSQMEKPATSDSLKDSETTPKKAKTPAKSKVAQTKDKK